MGWRILFGALVIVAGCSGKTSSDDDDNGGSSNDAGQGGGAVLGGTSGSLGGSSAAHGGTSSSLGGTSAARGGSATRGGSGGDFSAGAIGGSGGSGGGLGGGVGGTGGTGVGGTGGGSSGVGGGGGVVDQNCTDISTDVPTAMITYGGDLGPPPTPQGGTIASGTYYLDTEVVYGMDAQCVNIEASYNALGIMLAEVVRFDAAGSSGGIEIALNASAQGQSQRQTGSGTYTTSGTTLSVNPTCGNTDSSGMSNAAPYTASGDELILFDNGSATCSPVVSTYRKL